MAQAKKAKERKDIRDMDKTKQEQSSAMSARNMVQAIRNMYNNTSSSSKADRGGPQREGDRPEWASAMSNKDYYRTSQSTYTCSATIRE